MPIPVPPGPTRSRLRNGVLIALVGPLLGLSGCAVGERPSLNPPRPSSPAASSDVIDLLQNAHDGRFTATYSTLTKFGGIERSATVTHDGADRRSITIGDIRFLTTDAEAVTCDLTSGECEPGFLPERVSDTQVSPDFYGGGTAARLRTEANRRIADIESSSESIAGESASCITIAVSGGEITGCALANGALARFLANDVEIELVEYSDRFDDSLMAQQR